MPNISQGKRNQCEPAVPVHEIRIDSYEPDERLVEELLRLNLLSEQLGYTAFSPEVFNRLLDLQQYRFDKSGNPEKEIFCCLYDAKIGRITDGRLTVLFYCEAARKREDHVCIAIYDLTKLRRSEYGVSFTYEKGALVAVLKIMDEAG